jgi:hypothetical protein
MPTIALPAEEIPVIADLDVLVVGGGPAGITAALAAARHGARTMIIEQFNCLGGVATAAGHGHICLYSSWGNPQWGTDEQVVAGLAEEIAQRVTAAGWGVYDRRNCDFEVEGMKIVLEQMAAEAGVRIRYHTFFSRTLVEAGRVVGVVVQSKSGRQAVLARRIVDATGDGDVAASAGCRFAVGNAEGRCQPATLMFQIGGVDWTRTSAFLKERAAAGDWKLATVWKRAQEAGHMRPFQSVIMGWWWTPTRPDQLGINFTHVTGVDATDADHLTAATLEGRRQVEETVALYRAYVPGLEQAHLLSTPPTIGLRESRRIMGDYVLTREDLVAEREFADSIGYGSFFIDIHNTEGTGMDRRAQRPHNGFKYQIPWRIQLPTGIEGLVTAGRCVSASHEALGSLRVMPQCMAMGQAAGTACALAVAQGCTPRALPVAELQAALRRDGCIVDAADIRWDGARASVAAQPPMPRAG